MFSCLRHASRLIVRFSALLVLLGTGGCCLEGSTQARGDPSLATESPLVCDSKDLILPESAVASAEVVDDSERRDRYIKRLRDSTMDRWFSLQLDLEQRVVGYNEPIPFQVTINNETDYPVVFFRPVHLTLGVGGEFADLQVELLSSAGQRIEPDPSYAFFEPAEFPPSGRESFSVLPPRSSCRMDFELNWFETWAPLTEPIPPGDYEMRIRLSGSKIGPLLQRGAYQDHSTWTYADVGAWVGFTELSDPVSFSIRPAGE
jgi:hypothetical protein